MSDEQKIEIINELKKLSKIEIAYLRELIMQNLSYMALGYTINDIIGILDWSFESDYEIYKKLLINITDHSKWSIEESIFIEEEKTGLYDESI